MTADRLSQAIRKTLPSTWKTALWVVKVTVSVSFSILLLRGMGVLPYISDLLSPLFVHFGLPGEAALAYVSGYFVNIYSAIAAAVSLGLDGRAVTILAVMVLCSHNMILETAVQKKTGTPAARMVVVRTVSGIILAYVLNLILPVGREELISAAPSVTEGLPFKELFMEWLRSTAVLVPKMILIIFSLNILQSVLSEFGVIKVISDLFRPLMRVFGLPPESSLLWIIANTVGLAYGGALMIEEAGKGGLDKREIDMLNTHIGISHSNLEDLSLLASIGAVWWILLLVRWLMSVVLVWEFRLELYIKEKVVSL